MTKGLESIAYFKKTIGDVNHLVANEYDSACRPNDVDGMIGIAARSIVTGYYIKGLKESATSFAKALSRSEREEIYFCW